MKDVLQYLIEKEQITETATRLFIATDKRDWEAVKACFASEVLFDASSMNGDDPVTLTPQQIADAWQEGLKDLKAIHHQVGNFLININGNEADLFCYGIASHYLPNITNNNIRVFVGSYDFHLRKNDAGWKIDVFRFNLKYIDGNKNLT